jgi:hypothetical protein
MKHAAPEAYLGMTPLEATCFFCEHRHTTTLVCPDKETGLLVCLTGIILAPFLVGTPIVIYGLYLRRQTITKLCCEGCGFSF